MVNEDIIRELEKINDALRGADIHLSRQNESNAALHLADRVLYSPLTVAVSNARDSVIRLISHFQALGTEPTDSGGNR